MMRRRLIQLDNRDMPVNGRVRRMSIAGKFGEKPIILRCEVKITVMMQRVRPIAH